MTGFKEYYGLATPIEMQEVEEIQEEIKQKAMFPILENVRLLQIAIEQKVCGNVMVMLSDNNTILIKVRNDGLEYRYGAESCCLQDSVAIVLHDFLYHYKKEILKKYFKGAKSE